MFSPIFPLNYNDMWEINSDTGECVWKITRTGCKKGDKVGYIQVGKNGYKNIKVELTYNGISKGFQLHRILYFIYHGIDPKNETVDHKDRNPLNNAKSNLRLATRRIQAINRKKYEKNKSGITGVWSAGYMAEFTFPNGERENHRFQDFFEACCWRKSMENKYNWDEIRPYD